MHRNKYTLIQEAPSSFTDKMHAVQGTDKLRPYHQDPRDRILKPIPFSTLEAEAICYFYHKG